MTKILIVDDSWLTRRGVKRILEAQAYDVIEAENGLTALELIKSSDIDCILLDLLMPEMSGIEFLEKINESNIKIPAVVLTADIQITMKKRCLDLGAKAFINKPPDPEELIQILSSLQ